jgi:hypothetical protein
VGALTGFTLSGEEKQINFTGAGTVLVQSSERGIARSGALTHLLAQLPGFTKSELAELSASAQQVMKTGRS